MRKRTKRIKKSEKTTVFHKQKLFDNQQRLALSIQRIPKETTAFQTIKKQAFYTLFHRCGKSCGKTFTLL